MYINNYLHRTPQCTKEKIRKRKRKKTHTNTQVHHNTIPPILNSLNGLEIILLYQKPHWLRKYKRACNSLNVHVHVVQQATCT